MFRLLIVGILFGLCLSVGVFAQTHPAQKPAPAKPATPAPPAKPDYPLDALTEFSATMVGGIMGNVDELKIYRSGNLMHTEMLDGNYMVSDLASRDTFVVLPDRCVHDPRPAVNTFPFSAVHPGYKVERSALPNEDLEGHTCQVENVTITPVHGLPLTLKLWEALDLSGFPLKVEVHSMTGPPVTIRYKDVTIGRPDPALFRHPANCRATAQPGGKMGKPVPPAKESTTAPKPAQN